MFCFLSLPLFIEQPVFSPSCLVLFYVSIFIYKTGRFLCRVMFYFLSVYLLIKQPLFSLSYRVLFSVSRSIYRKPVLSPTCYLLFSVSIFICKPATFLSVMSCVVSASVSIYLNSMSYFVCLYIHL